MFLSGLILVAYATLSCAEGGGSSCQDIDHDACVSMGKQNSQMCADPILSNSACPSYCSNCPLTCYNCNTTNADVQQCNTVTCQNGEMCMLKTVQTGSRSKYHIMRCGPTMICSVVGKRSTGPDISIHCCGHDLCNAPTAKTTTSLKTTTRITTPLTTTATATTANQLTTFSTRKHPLSTLRTTTLPLCVRDVIFMVDDSLSMLQSFGSIKDAIVDIIDHLQIGATKTRVALGTFNIQASTRWELNSFSDKVALQNKVRNLVPSGLPSYIATNQVAIAKVLGGFHKGDRPSVPNVVVLLTKGEYQVPDLGLPELFAIEQLHRNSHSVIVIAAGGVFAFEAKAIATGSNHLFRINSPDDYKQQQLSTKIAQLIYQ